MKKKYLITGATGFVGSNIVRTLVKKGEDVSIISRSKSANWRIKDLENYLNIYECDILSPKLLDVVRTAKPDYIFHLASYGVLSNQKKLSEINKVNLKGTENLISCLKRISFRMLINTGTFFEYGGSVGKISESHSIRPVNDYAKSKAEATMLATQEAIKNDLPIITLRLFSPYGYFEDRNRLIPSTILSSLRDAKIKVSSPSYVRDFVFIEDLVRAYITCTEVLLKPGEIINIGSGHQHSIKEVVDTVLKLTKSESEVEWGSVGQKIQEPGSWEANISKARKLIGWRPQNNFEQGLRKNISWFKKNLDLYD